MAPRQKKNYHQIDTKSDWQIGELSRGSILGVPSDVTYVHISCICTVTEQRLIADLITRVQAIAAQYPDEKLQTTHARDQNKHARFSMKQAARQAHHSNQVFFINETMQAELEFSRAMLQPDSGVKWETPFAFKIKKCQPLLQQVIYA